MIQANCFELSSVIISKSLFLLTKNASNISPSQLACHEPVQTQTSLPKDILDYEKQLDRLANSSGNLVYDHNDEEPELHARTYFALAAVCLLNFVQVFALQGPPAVVRHYNPGGQVQGTDYRTAFLRGKGSQESECSNLDSQ